MKSNPNICSMVHCHGLLSSRVLESRIPQESLFLFDDFVPEYGKSLLSEGMRGMVVEPGSVSPST